MRIGIDARFLTHSQHGGFKSYTRAIVSALAEVDAENQYILYTDRPPSRDLPGNFTVKPVKGMNAVIREQIVLPLMMRKDHVDIVHFPCNTGPVLPGLPMIATIHDIISFRRRRYENKRQRLLNSYWRAVIPRCARRSRLVLTVSSHVVGDLVQMLALPREKIRVIHNSVDPLFLGDEQGTRPSAMDQGVQFILAFASADGRKNHKGVMEAYKMLQPEFPKLKLAVVCSNSRTKSDCDTGIPMKNVSNRELVWLYRNALAFVFPSFDEGFGLPPLEAMACRTPVVSSEAGALAEVVNGCSISVDPDNVRSIADGLRLALTNEAMRRKLVEAGRDRAESFSRRRMGEKLLAAYAEASPITHHESLVTDHANEDPLPHPNLPISTNKRRGDQDLQHPQAPGDSP